MKIQQFYQSSVDTEILTQPLSLGHNFFEIIVDMVTRVHGPLPSLIWPKFSASVVSPTRLGEMLASAENMEDPDGELTDGETFRMGNVQERILSWSRYFIFARAISCIIHLHVIDNNRWKFI